MNESERALYWRKHVVKLTREQLAKRTGYSVTAIQIFERGRNWLDVDATENAWKKYRLACAAVHLGVHHFDWEHTKCVSTAARRPVNSSTSFGTS